MSGAVPWRAPEASGCRSTVPGLFLIASDEVTAELGTCGSIATTGVRQQLLVGHSNAAGRRRVRRAG
jgi:hypothetical protein